MSETEVSLAATAGIKPWAPPVAEEPFDDPAADLIVRTLDNVDFRLFKSILVIASPVFRDMCSQHSQKPAGATQSPSDGSTLVYISEDSQTFDCLMRFIYSAQFLKSHPVDVYAIACRMHLEEEAVSAAKALKDMYPRSTYPFIAGNFSRTLPGILFTSRMAGEVRPRMCACCGIFGFRAIHPYALPIRATQVRSTRHAK